VVRAASRVLIAALLAVAPASAVASDQEIDLDRWHAERRLDTDRVTDSPRLTLGLYPGVAGVIGLPNGVAGTGELYVSLTARDRFSIFAGYGHEWGPASESESYTLGWGGVRALPVATSQRGFHGTFLRYRRWTHDRHGVHHGISVGTESGAGFLGLGLELGAARSDRNHWLIVARVSLKVPIPILIPLAR